MMANKRRPASLMVLLVTLGACATGLFAAVASAQTPASTPLVDAAQVEATLKKARAENLIDQLMRETVVDGHKMAVALVRRVKPDANGLIHNHVTEVYQIMQGSGTLVSGGKLVNAKPNDLAVLAAGTGQSGTHEGGEKRRVGAGDVIFLPAGTAHSFNQLDGEIVYLVYRFDSLSTKK